MSDAGSINAIMSEPSAKKYVKYTPLFKARRGSDDSRSGASGSGSCAMRATRILGAALLALLLVAGALGTVVMWATDMFDALIDDRLVLRNGSAAFEAWRRSPVRPIMRFRIFNYTNVDAFRAGEDERLRVVEAGPYVFRETTERVNIQFHSNGSLTYQDRRRYDFEPHLSEGSLDDVVYSLNLPLLTLNYMERRASYLRRLPTVTALRLMAPQPLFRRTAREVFWGYSDSLTRLAAARDRSFKIGVLEQKNGTSPHRLTIHSGAGDLRRLGLISHFDGRDHVDFYATAECNRVDGSDGSKFPPPAVRRGGRLYIYHRDICRRVPLDAAESVTVFERIPALRFRPPADLLADGDANPANACYCLEDAHDLCPPSGVAGTQPCKRNAPIFASLPHFLRGDPALRQAVEGLSPDPQRHDIYLDIHQRMGVPLAGRTRFQFNVLVKDTFSEYTLKRLDEKLLPFVWLERDLGEFPAAVQEVLYAVSVTAPRVKHALKWGCPAVAAVAGLVLMAWAAAALARLLAQPQPQPPETYVMSRL